MGSVNLCCIEPRRAERSIRGGREENKSMQGWRECWAGCAGAAALSLKHFPSIRACRWNSASQATGFVLHSSACAVQAAQGREQLILPHLAGPAPSTPNRLFGELCRLRQQLWGAGRGWAPRGCSMITFTESWNDRMVGLEGTKGP